MFEIRCFGLFIVYLHAKPDIPSSSGSLVITTKLKVKEEFVQSISCWFKFYKNITTKQWIFPQGLSSYITPQ